MAIHKDAVNVRGLGDRPHDDGNGRSPACIRVDATNAPNQRPNDLLDNEVAIACGNRRRVKFYPFNRAKTAKQSPTQSNN